MAQTIACPACQKQYRVDESRFGRKLKCQCGNIFRVPVALNAELGDSSGDTNRVASFETGRAMEERAASEAPRLNANEVNFADPSPKASGPAGMVFVDDEFKLEPLRQPVKAEEPPLPKQTVPIAQTRIASGAAQPPTTKRPKNSRAFFGIKQNYMFQCGQALAWVGFLGLLLPRMGLQLVMLQAAGSPEQIRVLAMVSMVAAAGLLLFSQGRSFVKGGAMALFSLVVLGLLCMPTNRADKERHLLVVVQPQIESPAPQIRPDPIPQHELTRELAQQPALQPQFSQPLRIDPEPPPEIRRLAPGLRLKPGGSPWEMHPMQSEVNNFPRTNKAGGPGGAPFAKVDLKRRPVLGFLWNTSMWEGGSTLADLTPVYVADEDEMPGLGPEPSVVAKKGYAVGGINVSAVKVVRGVQIVFMKLDGDRLKPDDQYVSDWIGTKVSDSTTALTTDGKIAIGVFGNQGLVLDSVGLVLRDN